MKKIIAAMSFAYIIIASTLLVMIYNKNQKTSNFTCATDIVLTNKDRVFSGLIDFNVSPTSGLVNINGYFTAPDKKEYMVNRSIIFQASLQGNAPVWMSKEISLAVADTAPIEQLRGLVPLVFLEPSRIGNVEIKRLNKSAYLLTKENLPYAYCKF
ncbi:MULTISPECIES: hypothetical protein [Buttiauxella]|jgi:hypothetical protein|uniref:FidL-like membrane protein n=1 Tax=Buttiauxella ferragutiae ATCC 51602 TaxID=1354252 RepID=A0ABX2WCA8_9ENTR|nr:MULTISPECIES: hypothetical protein [Buttiauxella]AYN28360.1 hypothetical protein D8682_16080 [Buttiauxella sp. 3AFRM03]MCE0827469.1 hypothetical protein [Buttiauxella ferragutiae]OAT30243.1 hypothetical protein M976_01018 [Buttiauxella ferragutiae ATCC 51602]TDN52863.1 hypothetical protein EC843_102297 [Buttiauxella sp. JUb87]UNK61496.1 hypothetical protein MNO13_00605 [Buttiauxella ferragutiae]